MNNDTMVEANSTFSNENCDLTIESRRVFISIGSCLSVVGCASNILLLYVFFCKGRLYPFQTLLAVLDFMLCALYIECFGFHLISVDYELGLLYKFVMDNNVLSFAMSRVVQLLIPYTLIANSADKLAMIYGIGASSDNSFRFRVWVIIIMILVGTLLRLNTFAVLKVTTNVNCPLFQQRWMGKDESLDEFYHTISDSYEKSLTFFNTFVSFVVLFGLNSFIVCKLSAQHRSTRRQSTSTNQLFSTSIALNQTAEIVRDQQSKLRCAVKTTVVIISAYLACNSLNFACYVWESTEQIYDETGNYSPIYILLSDIATILFVLSSSCRIFIYYKYNSDIRQDMKNMKAEWMKCFKSDNKAKTEVLLRVHL